MKITRRYALIATAGEYQEGSVLRRRHVRVSTLAETPTGLVVFLDAHFNPAGIPRPEGQQSVLLSAHPYEDKGGQRDTPLSEDNPF